MDYPYETGNWNRYEIIVLPIALLVIIITTVLLGVFLKNKSLKDFRKNFVKKLLHLNFTAEGVPVHVWVSVPMQRNLQ